MVRARGADLVWQPRYGPEFKAYEEKWPKVKHPVRHARADTAALLSEALASATGAPTWEASGVATTRG